MTAPSIPWVTAVTPSAEGAVVAQLVTRALARERTAERLLYEHHARDVRSFAMRRLRDTADAADVVQETFVRAFRLLPTLAEPGRFAPWLFGIARNVCRECVKARRAARRPAPPMLSGQGAQVVDPEHELLGREAQRALIQARARMPEGRRRALALRVELGLPYQQIARSLGWSVAKAKVEVHRARRTLQAALALSMTMLLAFALVGARPTTLPEPPALTDGAGSLATEPVEVVESTESAPMSVEVDEDCALVTPRPDAGVEVTPAQACTPNDIPWTQSP